MLSRAIPYISWKTVRAPYQICGCLVLSRNGPSFMIATLRLRESCQGDWLSTLKGPTIHVVAGTSWRLTLSGKNVLVGVWVVGARDKLLLRHISSAYVEICRPLAELWLDIAENNVLEASTHSTLRFSVQYEWQRPSRVQVSTNSNLAFYLTRSQ